MDFLNMGDSHDQLDLLLVSHDPVWPLDQGFRVRGYHMAGALADQGQRIGVASVNPLPDDAPEQLKAMHIPWPDQPRTTAESLKQSWTSRRGNARLRYARWQQIDLQALCGLIDLVDQHKPRAVIGLGQPAPLMLSVIQDRPAARLWYAADELVNFHLSCLPRDPLAAWPDRFRGMAQHFVMEQLFVRGLDGAVGVSPRDTRLLRWLAGARQTALIRNGVDQTYFHPDASRVKPHSLVFWGRMDFEPNVDAVCWFARNVWPWVKQQWSNATWSIVGKHPTSAVKALASQPGIEVTGAVADVREHAWRAAAMILPMRCGGGIKNKLLEAAALGLPILASPHALRGLSFTDDDRPMMICRQPQGHGGWVDRLGQLWSNPAMDAHYRRKARLWAQREYTWDAAAKNMLNFVNQCTDDAGRFHRPVELSLQHTRPQEAA